MNSKGQYPTQPTYPVQPPGNPVYPQTLHLPQAPPYTDAPPAYSELYPTAGNIPPPPPGCPPNAAQLAVMQGANVLVTQRKGNFFVGGSHGGYTIW
ncbi:PREDICTED: DAZ-associated protein 2-like isoform X4 [Elephantulus edwardii]|uniref:DAZ-associated protein 2-like isoform X4 n=1 Tax=Elephantulus edwardii TaxID=28737 RepID=UPI0003F07982|nr:PREDICTED: DAZ-associated protein 2-like isoform X4 [Elephantulus edwardii]